MSRILKITIGMFILVASYASYVWLMQNSESINQELYKQAENTSLLKLTSATPYPKIHKEVQTREDLDKNLNTLEAYENSSGKINLNDYGVDYNDINHLLFMIAILYENLGMPDEAESVYLKFIHKKGDPTIRDGDLASYKTFAAINYSTLGNYKESNRLLEEALSLDPDDIRAVKAKISNSIRVRDFEQAYKLTLEALNVDELLNNDLAHIAANHILALEFCNCAKPNINIKKQIRYKELDSVNRQIVDSLLDEPEWESKFVYAILKVMNGGDSYYYKDLADGRKCEATFYRGAFEEARGNIEKAKLYYAESIRTKAFSYPEYHQAVLYLDYLESQQ